MMADPTCKLCEKPFARAAKSVAAYCSNKCRSDAKDAVEAAKREERNAPLVAILNAPPTEVTEIAIVTYQAHGVVWKVRGGAGGFFGTSPHEERTFATLNLHQMPDYVRDALASNPDLIPAEVAALDPDPMRAIKLHQLAVSSPQRWLGLYDDED